MKKIPSLFLRDEKTRQLTEEINPAAQWVFDGEGVATRKYDGTSCLIKDGQLMKRREIKAGKPTPEYFLQADFDEITGKTVGWLPLDQQDRWHLEALHQKSEILPDGTYELIGPKVQGNPERSDKHILIQHSTAERLDVTRTPEGILEALSTDIEGLVFHHPDGRYAKIKGKDFGIKRPTID